MVSSDLDLKAIAIHEAGHAVVAHRLGERVTGMELEESFGWTGIKPPPAGARRARIERVATVFLAGDIALAMYRGVSTLTFAALMDTLGDTARATALVGRVRGITQPEITEILRGRAQRAGSLLNARENWALVERLADELVTKRSLTAREVAAIVPLCRESRESR